MHMVICIALPCILPSAWQFNIVAKIEPEHDENALSPFLDIIHKQQQQEAAVFLFSFFLSFPYLFFSLSFFIICYHFSTDHSPRLSFLSASTNRKQQNIAMASKRNKLYLQPHEGISHPPGNLKIDMLYQNGHNHKLFRQLRTSDYYKYI